MAQLCRSSLRGKKCKAEPRPSVGCRCCRALLRYATRSSRYASRSRMRQRAAAIAASGSRPPRSGGAGALPGAEARCGPPLPPLPPLQQLPLMPRAAVELQRTPVARVFYQRQLPQQLQREETGHYALYFSLGLYAHMCRKMPLLMPSVSNRILALLLFLINLTAASCKLQRGQKRK